MSTATGPVIIDLVGPSVTVEEVELLNHPLVGGVILFARNYESPGQLTNLCQQIRAGAARPILIAVDQEGGRVQRFKEGFTLIPSMGEIGELYLQDKLQAQQLAYDCGWLIAAELTSVGVDLSFAPVLDLNKNNHSNVIGMRAFSGDIAIVAELGRFFCQAFHDVGMAATGKHFPGHGHVRADSHLELPIDTRSYDEIAQIDMQPFKQLIAHQIDAIMPAHIVFNAVDDLPVGFSAKWLKNILRGELNFNGIIFSDDLNMAGANSAGSYLDRANQALAAGCDMVLICNNRLGAIQILEGLPASAAIPVTKIHRLLSKNHNLSLAQLRASKAWQDRYYSFNQYRKTHVGHT
jgi:beta-N-acetylhexosaminidase